MRKLLFTVCAFLLSGNAFFFCGCESGFVSEGVQINGISVGGLEYQEAIARVRNRLSEGIKPLTIHSPAGDYTVRYPEISFTDDLSILVRIARKNENYSAKTWRNWANAERVVESICAKNAKERKDARVNFTAEGFEYFPEERGIACDYAQLMEQITQALAQNQEEVALATRETVPAVTEESLRQKTQLLSQFTTYFDETNVPRVNNIKLSSSRIAGIVLDAGEEFSFNGVVGLRTAENGYENATVIQNGVFTDGIGGGVCQTSTTLFNAALLAGMRITESRNHSLSIGYVPPSLDAMVSEYSDLKFENPYEEPVYLLSEVKGDSITFRFYGLPDGKRYQTESVLLEEVLPPPAEIVTGEWEETIREEKKGLKSESYRLTYSSDGVLLSRELIRQDSYLAVQGIYQVLPE